MDFLVFQLAADDDFLFGPTLYLQPLERQPAEPVGVPATLEFNELTGRPAGAPSRP